MANRIDTSKANNQTRVLTGRRIIYSDVDEVTSENVMSVLQKALNVHNINRNEIQYLWDYYCGKQPILNRIKDVRPEICNKIVENHANEIVSFKVGYLCGEPIQYIGTNADERTAEAITRLNEFMFAEDKASLDREIVEWQSVCGTAYRMVLPDSPSDIDEAPFEIFTLDPRDTFIVYSNGVDKKPLMGVTYKIDSDSVPHYSIYTPNFFYKIDGDILNVEKSIPHALGMIPIIEYPANTPRLGSFEIVLPLLDAINTISSNRLDGVEQVVQAFLKFINCDITLEEFNEFKREGAIKVKSLNGMNADVAMVTTELDQGQTQITKEDYYSSIITICGIPNRNGGSSTSDTGAAVLLRDGWSLAEARAKDSEHVFKKAEKQALKLVLKILRDTGDLNIRLSDVDMKFTRRNYEAIQSKAQVLIAMLEQDKIHPQLAFTHCGMFSDPEGAYLLSKEYWEDIQSKTQPTVEPNNDSNESGENITEKL